MPLYQFQGAYIPQTLASLAKNPQDWSIPQFHPEKSAVHYLKDDSYRATSKQEKNYGHSH